MLRKLVQRLLGRTDDGEVDVSSVERDRLLTHPSDNDDERAANEAFDDGVRHTPPSGPF